MTREARRTDSPCRLLILGGFLGAGKTTALLRLAAMHVREGLRVGMIANDMGEGMVDAETYRAHGLSVEEMSGVCFACRFEELVAAMGRLQDGYRPDVLLAEPAGSCTDIFSRVVAPLRELYGDRFQVAPYVTLLDPHRARQALGGQEPGGFSAKVTFLYKMQQNEAEIVGINKVDLLSPGERREIRDLVEKNFPRARILFLSARTGEGFDELMDFLDAPTVTPPENPNETPSSCSWTQPGEDELAWTALETEVIKSEGFDPNHFLLTLAEAIRVALADIPAEPGHVKMILRSGDDFAIANLVASGQPASLSRQCSRSFTKGILTINARVETAPDTLRELIRDVLKQVALKYFGFCV